VPCGSVVGVSLLSLRERYLWEFGSQYSAKDSVRKDGVVVIQMVFVPSLSVDVESFYCV
jgi:hypothetical protein